MPLWHAMHELLSYHKVVHVVNYTAGHKQGDHLFEKPGNVSEFDSSQGNVGDFYRASGC